MPRHQGLDRGGRQIVGAHLGERAAEAADRGPHGIAYKYITHRSLPECRVFRADRLELRASFRSGDAAGQLMAVRSSGAFARGPSCPKRPVSRATARREGGKHAWRRQTNRIARQNFVVCAANDDPAIHPRATRRRARRRGRGARHADDGAIPRDQGRQSRAAAVLPDGRFLRAVLRGRRDRLQDARHRADQARQASGHGYPDVRRAGGTLRGLSASPDRAGPSRRGVRADRGSGRGARARQQERGAPRRGAAGDAGHADRRHACWTRRANNYLLAIARARGSAGADRIGLAWIDISTSEFIVTECATGELAATLSRINPNEVIVTDALYGDPELGPLLARIAGGDAADPRLLRQRHRRAAAVRLFRGRHHGRPLRDVAAGGDRGGRRRHLYRPHPGRKASAAVAALARGRRHHHGDRSRRPAPISN